MPTTPAPPPPKAPTAPPNPDAPPKRAKGRAPARTSTRSLETEIAGALWRVNLFVTIVSSRNALDMVEITALAKTLDAQAKANRRVREIIETALRATAVGDIGLVAIAIVGRRAARNGVLRVVGVSDAEATWVDAMLGESLRSIAEVEEGAPPSAPAPPAPDQPAKDGSNGPIEITPEMLRPSGSVADQPSDA